MKRYTPTKIKSPTAKMVPHHRQERVPRIHVASNAVVEAHPWSARGRSRKTHNM